MAAPLLDLSWPHRHNPYKYQGPEAPTGNPLLWCTHTPHEKRRLPQHTTKEGVVSTHRHYAKYRTRREWFLRQGARWRHVSIDVEDVSSTEKMFAEHSSESCHPQGRWRAPDENQFKDLLAEAECRP